MAQKSGKQKKHFLTTLQNILTNPFIISVIVISIAMYILMVYIYKSEHATVMDTPFDAVWFFFVTFIAGYFDFSPQTVPGRILSLIVLLTGVLGFSAITGKIASVLLDIQMKKEKGLIKLKNMSKQFVLCGWRRGFDKILDSVLNTNPDITADMIVLINEATSEQMEQIHSQPRFKDIKYVAGDFTDESVLARAQIAKAERALIISDYSKNYSQLEMDSRTVLAALTITNINPGIYIAAELIDSKFEKHLQMAHCDEVILTTDYEHSLLASASSGMGYSNVMRELISDDADSGIIIENIAPTFIGKTYKEYKSTLKSDGVLIGLLLNTGNFYQRRKDALREAQKNPDVKKIVDNLKKIKLLRSNEPILTPPDDYIIVPFTKAIFVKGKEEVAEYDKDGGTE